jgi:hypothetical protein
MRRARHNADRPAPETVLHRLRWSPRFLHGKPRGKLQIGAREGVGGACFRCRGQPCYDGLALAQFQRALQFVPWNSLYLAFVGKLQPGADGAGKIDMKTRQPALTVQEVERRKIRRGQKPQPRQRRQIRF